MATEGMATEGFEGYDVETERAALLGAVVAAHDGSAAP